MSDWKYIDEYASLPDADFIHCDTRDFHILCNTCDDEYREKVKKDLKKHMNNCPNCRFTSSEILKVLKGLETRSGGRGHWSYITTKSHPTWLKYIRFIKTNKVTDGEPVYIAYSTSGDKTEVLSHTLLSESINEEYLNHMQYGKYCF